MRRFRLNPCDYLFFALDRMMAARGQLGSIAMMLMELDGAIDPVRLRTGVMRAMQVHPVTGAGIRYSRLGGRPWWVERNGESGTDVPLRVHDLRSAPDWPAAIADLRTQRFAETWDIFRGPQFQIDYAHGAGSVGEIILRWPHPLMDAEGAQWFLSEISRLAADEVAPPPPALRPEEQAVNVLADWSPQARAGLYWRGFRMRRQHAKVPRIELGRLPAGGITGLRIHRRVFEAADVARLEGHARAVCPRGPALVPRYLAGCVIRAVHRVYSARGIETPAYLITLPMHVRRPRARPVHGNYVVAGTLCGRRERVDDARGLAADLYAQLRGFRDRQVVEATWAMLQIAGLMRAWQYQIVLRLPIGLEPYASGFSYYGEIDPPLRSFLGARVPNLWGATPLGAPPGWNPLFAKFADRLTFSLTWLKDYIADDLALEFASNIEREAIGGPEAKPCP